MPNHYRITVNCNSEELKDLAVKLKAKAVSIDLWKDSQSQIDRMLTKYHRCLDILRNKSSQDIQYLEALGYKVNRLKIEKVVENFSIEDLNDCLYIEGHIKVQCEKPLNEVKGFILSKSVSKSNTKFYNFRIRNLQDYTLVVANLPLVLSNDVVSVEYEKIIYDSNINHDAWWG